ncbi:DUF4097 family beta strand repeat-containing protein [Granulicella arctica]|uniref:DUF4097 and DUF4098 domain-containing protein YvlB n=1 Tax=Granulicella arctica TaxID=940613 RepID=A0A7Y9TLJ3_9BACT|nr:DUF4097 family beta strand repeat-containing protein [Granulicella arctica]NYF80187.1 DUF4097 and DUF4098 domain-containing protein YvlB [Granulicella arctica]
MKAITLLAALTLTTATAFATDRTFDRTLSVSSTPNVSVSTGSGNIHLHPGSDSQIHIIGRIHANNNGWFSTSSDVEGRINQIVGNPPIQQNGAEVVIGEHHGDNGLYRNISVDYDVTLPRASNIVANSGSGDVHIEDVGSSLKANTGSGNIDAHGIHGIANLETGSGNIDFDETATGDVRAQTGSGNIHLNGIAGGLRAGTGSGDITIAGNPTTDWKLETGSGNIRLNLGSSARYHLDASTGSGDVHVEQPITMQGSLTKHHINGTVNGGGPTLRAETGSGDIEIR